MITMNQVESGPESHLYDAVRMIFGAALLAMGLLMAAMGLMAGRVASLGLVLGVAILYMAVGGGMLARQAWARWGFYIVGGMTLIGAAQATLRAQSLERSVTWDRPIAAAVGLFFAWGIWMLTRPGAKEQWRMKG
ncbi:MAG: hypothetical protein AB1515_03310 [Nitrospirota bacterium]